MRSRYPSYRDAGAPWLGEIPMQWEVKRLKRVAEMKSGSGITSEAIADNGDYPVYGGGGLRGYTNSFTHEGHFPLIGRQGALCGNVNYANGRFWASEHAVVAKPLNGGNPVWLGELLRAMNLNQYSISAAQPGLAVDTIKELPVPVPPLATQRAIADFLDRKTRAIDELIRKKERLIELLQEKRQALITQAVTKGLDPNAPMKDSGVPWLGEISAHWKCLPLRRRWKVVDCKHQTPVYVDEGFKLVSTTEVKPGLLSLDGVTRFVDANWFADMTEGRLPKRGDIILSRNASLGAAAYVDTDEPFCMGQDVVLITSTDQDQLFLSYQLNSQVGASQIALACVGATFKRINVAQIANLVVAMPPPVEQRRISDFLEGATGLVDQIGRQLSTQINRLIEYRHALISAAVTGQIDVTEEAAVAHDRELRHEVTVP